MPVRDLLIQFQSQTGSQALSDALPTFAPCAATCKFQSQTGSQALSDPLAAYREKKKECVSIPNGKPGPLRLSVKSNIWYMRPVVSIPNGKPGPLRHKLFRRNTCDLRRFNPKREARPSQTPSSGARYHWRGRFNPKREARPSQTTPPALPLRAVSTFQSQTGSQALSDIAGLDARPNKLEVSIPNGKPGPLRPRYDSGLGSSYQCFNPKREAMPSQTRASSSLTFLCTVFQSQTGSQALSDASGDDGDSGDDDGFNPKREARPSQTVRLG